MPQRNEERRGQLPLQISRVFQLRGAQARMALEVEKLRDAQARDAWEEVFFRMWHQREGLTPVTFLQEWKATEEEALERVRARGRELEERLAEYARTLDEAATRP